MKKPISLSVPVIGDEEWNEVRNPLQSGWVTSGPYVKKFEERFAQMHDAKYASAVSNCTNALHLALLALGVGEGDEVVVPSFSWVSTANAVRYCGAEAIIADVDVRTYNMNPSSLGDKISSKTKAVVPVHLFGLCAEMDEIKKVCGDIPIIEDAACAAGSKYDGVFAGNLGEVACFSFHPRKSVTTGEGGMLTTNDAKYFEIINRLRNHGSYIDISDFEGPIPPHVLPDMPELGFNYRLSDIQAAIGYRQLERLNEIIEYKDQLATRYTNHLNAVEFINTPKIPMKCKHSWQAYVVTVTDESPVSRNDLMMKLQDNGISTRPGTQAIHLLSYYSKRYGIEPEDLPGAKKAYESTIALPLHPHMEESDVDYVVKTIADILK